MTTKIKTPAPAKTPGSTEGARATNAALAAKGGVSNLKMEPVRSAKAKTETPAKKGWRIKNYYVDKKVYEASADALAKAPNQVRIMMAHFAENFNDPSKAAQGRVMCQSAIDKGGLKTVIEPAVLFAYYRAKMEEFGLRLKDN